MSWLVSIPDLSLKDKLRFDFILFFPIKRGRSQKAIKTTKRTKQRPKAKPKGNRPLKTRARPGDLSHQNHKAKDQSATTNRVLGRKGKNTKNKGGRVQGQDIEGCCQPTNERGA